VEEDIASPGLGNRFFRNLVGGAPSPSEMKNMDEPAAYARKSGKPVSFGTAERGDPGEQPEVGVSSAAK